MRVEVSRSLMAKILSFVSVRRSATTNKKYLSDNDNFERTLLTEDEFFEINMLNKELGAEIEKIDHWDL